MLAPHQRGFFSKNGVPAIGGKPGMEKTLMERRRKILEGKNGRLAILEDQDTSTKAKFCKASF
jgi:hypothetical protein